MSPLPLEPSVPIASDHTADPAVGSVSTPVLPCHVWWSRPIRDPDRRVVEGLDDAERARYHAYRRPEDRARFITGRLLARWGLAAELRSDPGGVRLRTRCPRCGGPHGKPELPADPAIGFSIAHAGDRVVVATARAEGVGVDVERIGAPEGLDDRLAGVLSATERAVVRRLAPRERAVAFFTYWTRKEALLKATGRGLEVPLSSLEVTAPHEPAAVVRWPPSEPWRASGLRDLRGDVGYVACLAVLAARPLRIEEHHVEELGERA